MRHFVFFSLFLFVAVVAKADPLWLRYPSISPDGSQILFTYMGDIYKVSAVGGKAVQLTTHPSHDSYPIWSPDGKYIAFAGDRNGNFDIFIMSAEGGEARRLTTHSTKEIPYSFTPDGKEVVYGAAIEKPVESAAFPTGWGGELYAVSVKGGKTRRVISTPAELINFSKSGDSFLYQDKKGGENEWRKHHTSSVTRDIWLYDIKSDKHTQLTNRPGEDRNPVFAPDQERIYFLSERGGSFNVYSFPLSRPDDVTVETKFKSHPVRFLSISSTGELCFGYNGEIYTRKPGGSPAKVKVEIVRDEEQDRLNTFSFSSGASGATISNDGKQVAFTLRGEVFVTSAGYTTTKRITSTPEREQWVSFAPDNRKLVYASERGGNWNIYTATIEREEEIDFPNATLIKEEPLFKMSATERTVPTFSPDGSELAFVEDRTKLMVYNFKSRKVRQITDGRYRYRTDESFSYEWSPDGKWFVLSFVGNRHDPYTDIGIVSAAGDSDIINLTNSGYTDGNPRWVLGGDAILFLSERYGMRNHASWGSLSDVMIIFLNQDSYDKFRLNKEEYEVLKNEEKLAAKREAAIKGGAKGDEKGLGKNDSAGVGKDKREIMIELDGIEDRIVRLTPNSSNLGDAILNKDGDKLYYLASFEGGHDLWEMDLRSKSTRILHKLNGSWGQLVMDKDLKTLFILGRSMQKITLPGGKPENIGFRAEMDINPYKERAYMLDRVDRQIAKRFYVKDLHGVDWSEMVKNYKKFLPHINNNYDFSELLSELLGELNVSHTGGRFSPRLPGDATASLGLFTSRKGAGLLIDEVIEKGPFDKASSKAKSGDVIEKIDGVVIGKDDDYFPLLNNRVGKKVLISLRNSVGERWEEVVKPISISQERALLYQRWVKQRAADVERLSGGRLGYVHISSMDDASFRSVYADILGKYNECAGIVIDTRFNGGGRLHEDIEVLFSGEKYFTQVVRGMESCDMPSRRWNKASIMLVGEANYSNAHGTPWVYRYKGIGKIVGMPVPGTMTSVSWETLQDPTLVFGIPIIGYRIEDGSYLENQQLEPDVKIANTPALIDAGRDEQLERAVQVLLQNL